MDTKTAVAGTATIPLLIGAITILLPFLVLGAAGTQTPPTSGMCGGGGTAQTIGTVRLDAEQMGNAQTIVSVTATRGLPAYAAVVAVATAYTESTLHNYQTQSDHDSEGLFQQRISVYGASVAADPVRATGAFLDRLVGVPEWDTSPVGVDAQTVQISGHPERYQANVALAQHIVGQYWPTIAATAQPAPSTPSPATAPSTNPTDTVTDAPSSTVGTSSAPAPPICAGGGGAVTGGTIAGSIVGPHGNNVAGTTSIPAGFVISGTTQATIAVQYALAQLGKPYLFAAAGPEAFDCSGLTMAAWAAAGIALPHLAAAQTAAGTPEPTDLSQAVGGDLVMIPGADGTPQAPGHVGIIAGYVDQPDGRHLYLVQAPGWNDLPVELTEATEWSGQIDDVRHIA